MRQSTRNHRTEVRGNALRQKLSAQLHAPADSQASRRRGARGGAARLASVPKDRQGSCLRIQKNRQETKKQRNASCTEQ